MSQPANDEFSQHLSDDEASNHEDASDTGAAPKQQQQVIPQTTAISNIKLPILKKEEYDIWAMEMEHYLEYIDNDVWKVIQNGNSKKRISTGKDAVIRILPPVTTAEIQVVEKERKAKNILRMAIPKEHIRRFHGMDDAKEIWEAIRSRFGGLEKRILTVQTQCVNLMAIDNENYSMRLTIYPIDDCTITLEYLSMKKEIFKCLPPSNFFNNIPEKEVLAVLQMQLINFHLCQTTEDWTLLHEDLEQIDDVDIENDINWRNSNDWPFVSQPPLSGDNTPKPQEEIDDACIAGLVRKTSEHSFETESESLDEPNEMSKSRLEVTNEKDVSAPNSKEVAPSCVSHIKTPRQPLKDNETHKVNRKSWNDMMKRELGEGYSFTKKKCFVCGSLNHLIKDCDYYEKKMAKEAEVKRVVNTGNGVTKPFNSVRPNINTGRTNISSGRPKVNSDRPKVNTVSPKVNSVRPTSNSMSPKRPQMDQINQRRDFSTSYSSVRRPFAKEHPLKNMVDRGIFDSGCSGHMTGNKDQLEDFEEFNGGSVTFGGSKGYISGKGRIRVGNLDFDSVSFVKELGHFNLFSISQICDKQHKVLFTETECLVVSSDFKMPDENQILLKVPRHHNMYSFDMKTIFTPAKRLGSYQTGKNLNKLVKGNLVRGLPSKNQANNAVFSEETNVLYFRQTPESIASEEKDVKRELEEIALKHLGNVPENNTTSTPSVNTGSKTVNTGRLDHDDSLMPELEIFHKPETGIFDEASYDEEGVITDFNSLPTEIEVSPTPTLRIHSIHPKSQILGDPKSAVANKEQSASQIKISCSF
ncbi:hypothetical protein Tco_1337277 [Tanacetum coccineum]